MFPRMFQNGNEVFPGFGQKIKVWNRTGATTVVGGVALLDLTGADTDSTSISTNKRNAVACATATLAKLMPMVVFTEAVADNKEAEAICGYAVECNALVDSTTDIAEGDWLTGDNADDSLIKATVADDQLYALALEARTDNDEGTIRVLLFSFPLKGG